MAPQTATQLTERIEIGLRALLVNTDDLAEIAAEWADLADGERAALSLDWDHLMADYLPELNAQYRSGQMTPDQQVRYRDLLARLKEALPIIERLNLYRPPVSLEP